MKSMIDMMNSEVGIGIDSKSLWGAFVCSFFAVDILYNLK